MKIKTQFSALVILIIAIPILCIILLPTYMYFSSPNRALIKGNKNIVMYDGSPLTEADQIKLSETLHRLPRNFDIALFDVNFNLLNTNIKEFKSIQFDDENFVRYIQETSNKYFYQVATMTGEKHDILIVTRAPRHQEKRSKEIHFFQILIIFLLFLVFICALFVILISRTVFKSITLIQNQTKRIAEGNLNVLIDTKSKQRNEITSISESLEKMRLSLVDARTRRNKFIMGISHDLRTPVTVIKGYSEAVSDGMIQEADLPKTMELIESRAIQLEGMINTLIDFVKLDATEWYNSLKNESITKLIRDFANNAEITGTVFKRNIKATINLSEDVFIPLDSQLVTRVFENILSNAIRYSNENDSIFIIAEETPAEIVFKIQDTGVGMTEEDLNNIFDLFYRGTNSRREEGIGIGLAVVKTIIETLKWEINVESKKNEGSCFTILIPKKL